MPRGKMNDETKKAVSTKLARMFELAAVVGIGDAQLADMIGVSAWTLNKWRRTGHSRCLVKIDQMIGKLVAMALDTNKLGHQPSASTATKTFEAPEWDVEEAEEQELAKLARSGKPNGPVHDLAPKRAWHPGTKRARTHLVNTMVREATKLGIDRRRLEELAALDGVHENTIRRWLTGHQYPKPRSIKPIIARLKGMSKKVPAKPVAPSPAVVDLAAVVKAFSKLGPADRRALVEMLS